MVSDEIKRKKKADNTCINRLVSVRIFVSMRSICLSTAGILKKRQVVIYAA